MPDHAFSMILYNCVHVEQTNPANWSIVVMNTKAQWNRSALACWTKVPIVSHMVSAQLTNLPVIRKPIHFVNEDLKLDALVDLVCPSHSLMQADEGFPVVILQDTT